MWVICSGNKGGELQLKGCYCIKFEKKEIILIKKAIENLFRKQFWLYFQAQLNKDLNILPS